MGEEILKDVDGNELSEECIEELTNGKGEDDE
jgi:hypothetical protein